MKRILSLLLAVLVGVPAYADSPVIWNGAYARNLTSKGFLLSSGNQLNNDGAVNYAPQRAVNWTAESNVTVSDSFGTAADLSRANTTANGVKFTATGAGDAYFCKTIDTADYNVLMSIQWAQNATAGVASTYVAGDYQLDVYKSTDPACASGNTRLPLSTDVASLSPIPALSGPYRSTFTAPNATAQYLKVQITRVNNSHSLVLSNFYTGPGIVTQGAAVTAWTSWSPTPTSFGTTGTVTAQYRRVGDTLEATVGFAAGTMAAAVGSISLPTGLTINTTNMALTAAVSGNFSTNVGYYTSSNAANSIGNMGSVLVSSTNNALVYVGGMATSVPTATGTASFITMTSISGSSTFSFRFSVPINEWAGGGTNIVQNDVEFAYNTAGTTGAGSSDTTSFGYGPIGAAIGSIASTTVTGNSTTTMRARFPTPIQSGSALSLEVDGGTSGAQWYAVGNGAGAVQPGSTLGAASYGAGISIVNSTDVDAIFGNGGRTTTGVTYGIAGSTWAGISTWRWRVKKSSGGAAVGFGTATPNSAGIITSFSPTAQSSVNNVNGANYAMTTTDGIKTISYTTGGSSRTLTLPPPANNTGREINIKKVDSGGGTVIITQNASETIDGSATVTLYDQYSWMVIYCDGTNWFTTSSSENYTSSSTMTFGGTTGQPVSQLTRISKVGRTVTVALNFSSVTLSAGPPITLTGMPARFAPAATQFVAGGYLSGSATGYPTSISITASTGVISLFKDNTGNWVGGNTAASPTSYLTFTYLVN